ncbi:MAG: ferredoxin reductase, partial [Polyangiaceae bacterium]
MEAVIGEAGDATTIVLRPSRWRAHRAGQFVKVGVEIGGRILTRTYSISSSPSRDDGCFTVTVKAQPEGRVSNRIGALRAGDRVRIGLPQGEFVLPNSLPDQVLFITGGSGITPVASMLRWMSDLRVMPSVTHLHFARTREDVIFGRELAWLSLGRPQYALQVIETRRGGGRLGADLLREKCPDFASRETWACGPESLLDAASSLIASDKVHIERFRAKFASISDQGTARVQFGRSKKEVDAMSTRPLLEVAERAGIDAPHGCRIGICHSCDAALVSGCVRD